MNNLSRVRVLSWGLSLLLLSCTSPPVPSSRSQSDSVEPTTTQPSEQSPLAPEPEQKSTGSPQALPLSAQFAASGQIVQLEVARTPLEQEIGLMFRTSLAADRGMLFLFEPARPIQFWMRNTLIPLDMVFMLDGQIKAIATNAPPCTTDTCPTYGSEADVNQVIELPGGRAAELGLAVGQQLTIRSIEPQSSN
jgi:uncharacterized protein